MATQGMYAMAFAVVLPLSCGAAQAADPTVDDMLLALTPKPDALTATTRGIRAIAPTGPVSAEPPAMHHKFMVTPGPQVTETPSLDLTVVFRSGSTDLTPQATTLLSKLGMALNSPRLARYQFRIEGHTDTVGNKKDNQTLSQARAQKVADFLEHDFAIHADRLQPIGMGEDGLLIPTPDQTNEPRNRRVHVVNLGG